MRLLPLLLLTACVTTAPARSSTAQCPGSNEICLAGKDCTFDRAHDCTMCVCRRTDREAPQPAGPERAHPGGEPASRLPPLR
jgi:hypothetical protein